ncbi:MAG: symporter [Magnetovibrio sp.]|nr:symporter [Magnetovibrio sp.]
METSSVITQFFLPLSLAFIMFSVGLELKIDDFKRVALQPKAFAVGAISQVIALPLVAFLLLLVWPMAPALAVGVMIIAACPGGVTSNLLTYLARGDSALSVSMTAVISLASVITLPVIVGFSITHFMDVGATPALSIGNFVLSVFLITAVPVIIGMAMNHLAHSFARRFVRSLRIIATILFVTIIIGAIFAERANVVDYFHQAGPVTLALNLIMMGLAMGLAKVARLMRRQQTAITFECGLQNGTLAIFVAASLIGSKAMTIPAAIYSLLMFATATVYLIFSIRRRP